MRKTRNAVLEMGQVRGPFVRIIKGKGKVVPVLN
jgi:hypothetical protein